MDCVKGRDRLEDKEIDVTLLVEWLSDRAQVCRYIKLAQERVQCRGLVDRVLNLQEE
jgi:hypothetical protein